MSCPAHPDTEKVCPRCEQARRGKGTSDAKRAAAQRNARQPRPTARKKGKEKKAMRTNATPATPIPTQAQYEANERRMLAKQLRQVEEAPLADRRSARNDWANALLDPVLLMERADWLLRGNCGYDAMLAARETMASGRGNRLAAFAQLLAAVEWQCPAAFAREAARDLPAPDLDRASQALQDAYNAWLDETTREAHRNPE